MAMENQGKTQGSANNLENNVSEEAVKERRYIWMARAFALVACLALVANFILLGSLFALVPLVRVQPFYMHANDKNQQVISIERPAVETLSSQVLQESLVRQYVLAYLGIGADIGELERRWGLEGVVNWMSESSVYADFLPRATTLINQAKTDSLTRDVRILVANRLRSEGRGFDVWRVEVELTDMRRGDSRPTSTRWDVLLEVSFKPSRQGLRWEQRLRNPLGFTVSRFGIQEQK